MPPRSRTLALALLPALLGSVYRACGIGPYAMVLAAGAVLRFAAIVSLFLAAPVVLRRASRA